MVTDKIVERRSINKICLREFMDQKTLAAQNFELNAARIGALETNQAKHLELLRKNTTMTEDIHRRFNILEAGIKNNEVSLAEALKDWKHFSILKVDEGAARMTSIEAKQHEHSELLHTNITSLAVLKDGVGNVLTVVTALEGTKKTLGWIGKTGLWFGGLAGAWIAIRTALASNVKIQWPWL